MTLSYRHVDVFADKAFTGNSLAVFPGNPGLSTARMLAITRELRHFETIFLSAGDGTTDVTARVFDLFGELDFAGHPVLGAAAVLHERDGRPGPLRRTFRLTGRSVEVTTRRTATGYHAELDQGEPEFLAIVPERDRPEIAEALNLPGRALADLPLSVVSTGLRYLVVPVTAGLAEARIVREDFAELIARYGAQFAYVVDVEALEGRHWNNDGVLEDVATGSAAGCVGAYLARHRVVPVEEEFVLRQGRFTGRPSRISVLPQGTPDDLRDIRVGGDVTMVARGTLDTLPE
ncbi:MULTISPECIES: PhzF family phenazine biosynthesis protein [unclassified Streptomyces]|uniref:PhzF family phenazine biosynthesis protein n=1 Tax=unclassified Streptomyces TaxID=2593676 RepID=UPI00166096F0|nr:MULTISPECIES: PhzF family phenazine biosynthesis protein [unclassified Streptomyces]MBD0709467.1 phenazine biosynthesis protein PhzF [Streptomyces sp. CBMA291]MBD0713177.1 phenazine biosynthesis protein PhzF [Streptomyces sp. CBMA370]